MLIDGPTAVALTLVAIGGGLAAAVGGALRSAGHGPRMAWLVAGLGVGSMVAAFA